MRHFVCDINRNGGFDITTDSGALVTGGTCKQEDPNEKDEKKKWKFNPNVAWHALLKVYDNASS